MAQLSLYVDDEELEELRSEALRNNLSISKHVRAIIAKRKHNGGWPDGFFDLYGCMGSDDIDMNDAGLDPGLDDACDWFE